VISSRLTNAKPRRISQHAACIVKEENHISEVNERKQGKQGKSREKIIDKKYC
jgi:hypothetical protein